MKRLGWKPILLFIIAAPVVTRIGQYGGTLVYTALNGRQAAQTATPDDESIQVLVSSQDAEGVTQNAMGPEFLQNLERYTLDRVRVKASEALESRGLSAKDLQLSAESTYIEGDNTKLAIIRIQSQDGTNHAWIVGIVGRELKRVLCSTTQTAAVPVARGPCAEKIREVFGFRFSG